MFLKVFCFVLGFFAVSWVPTRSGTSYLGPGSDGLAPEPAGARRHQLVDQVEEEADRLAAALWAAHPGDLVPANALPVDARDGAGQPSVLQRSGAVHVRHLIQHGSPGQLSQETVHVVEAVRLQGRDEALHRNALQVCVR